LDSTVVASSYAYGTPRGTGNRGAPRTASEVELRVLYKSGSLGGKVEANNLYRGIKYPQDKPHRQMGVGGCKRIGRHREEIARFWFLGEKQEDLGLLPDWTSEEPTRRRGDKHQTGGFPQIQTGAPFTRQV